MDSSLLLTSHAAFSFPSPRLTSKVQGLPCLYTSTASVHLSPASSSGAR